MSKNSFLHVLQHQPTQIYGFFCKLYEFTIERFQAQVLTISSANHSTPQPPASVPHFLLPPSTEDDINSQRLKGAMLPCILFLATACQLCEFTLDLFHAQVITSSITIDCSPRPPAPVPNFLPPPVNENTLAWNSHRFKGAMYPHILLYKDCL